MNIELKSYQYTDKMKKISLGLIVAGVIGFVLAFFLNKYMGWVDFLVNNLYFITLSVSAIFFMAVQGLVQASWVSPFRRIFEAYGSYLYVSIFLMIPVVFGIHSIYEWSHMDIVNNDPILVQKKPWLNETFFIIRMFSYLCIWCAILWSQKRLSLRQEREGKPFVYEFSRNSSIHMILFALTISMAAFDWVMSVEPHWFSTIFGVYIFAGSFVSGIAFTILATSFLENKGYLQKYITADHYHDLGKWLFGMSVFWAYIWLSQYLLIWYANIPEETEYFVLRQEHWTGAFYLNLVLNWAIPFFVLLPRASKRNPKILKSVAVIVLIGHFLDLYLMVAPKVFEHAHTHLVGYGLIQLLEWCGFFGIFLMVFNKVLSSRNLFNTGDPYLEEGLHLHQ